MSNHTPGPWIYSGINNEGKISSTMFSRENGELVGTITTAKANASLIAAAPDMLDALQAIVDAFGDQNSLLIDQCKAALNKAKGVK